MKHLRLDMISMYYENKNDNRHPQEVMRDLEITYFHATPQSVADQWWFWCCDNIPEELPKFITELKSDPMKCIGWGLSEEMAKLIAEEENK